MAPTSERGSDVSKIIYLAHYDMPHGERLTSPAGTTVMNYVLNSLENIKRHAILVSPSCSKKELSREELVNGPYTKIVLLPTPSPAGKYNIASRFLNRLRQRRNLENELSKQLNDGDILMVYHSLSLMNVVRKIRKKKKITLLLQVCEVYGDVADNARVRKKELDFFKTADRYIFQSELLEHLINKENKPYAVLYGTYTVSETDVTQDNSSACSQKTHCVYAGTLDPRKGGAETALNTALYLPENYHVHILGFGSEKEIQYIKDRVSKVSSNCKCSVSYDGCLSGDEYKDFISSCQIGLSTQDPDASFNATSFPSKILAYIANGLRVVTVRIPAIEKSAVAENVFFYEENTPESVAAAIKSIDLTKAYDGKDTIRTLDKKFLANLQMLLQGESDD